MHIDKAEPRLSPNLYMSLYALRGRQSQSCPLQWAGYTQKVGEGYRRQSLSWSVIYDRVPCYIYMSLSILLYFCRKVFKRLAEVPSYIRILPKVLAFLLWRLAAQSRKNRYALAIYACLSFSPYLYPAHIFCPCIGAYMVVHVAMNVRRSGP